MGSSEESQDLILKTVGVNHLFFGEYIGKHLKAPITLYFPPPPLSPITARQNKAMQNLSVYNYVYMLENLKCPEMTASQKASLKIAINNY